MRATVFAVGIVLSASACGGGGILEPCGNGVLDPGEACDAEELGGESCESLGYYGGQLGCAADCKLDLRECEAAGRCGDGSIDIGEECDQTNLYGQTCETFGFPGGTLACAADCTLDLTDCAASVFCGNGILEASEGEECDGTAPNDETCLTLGYYGGNLACTAGCQLDLASCEAAGRCGDGAVDGGEGEECDGAALNDETCLTLGYYGGTLECAADCRFALASCAAAGRCGDGRIDIGEACDWTNLYDQTCETLGYHGGTLGCDEGCSFDLASCQVAGRCGDGAINGPESCDGTDLGSQSCVGLGYHDASLLCTGDCMLDLSPCQAAGFCGDGAINGPEECDGIALGGATCAALGHLGGPLGCGSGCTWDESGCIDDPCALADYQQTSTGCLFLAVDLDAYPGFDTLQYGLIATNPDPTEAANVAVQVRAAGTWTTSVTASVPASDQVVINLPDRHIDNVGLSVAGAYRVVSDRPIAVHQYNPLAADSFSTDSALLLPVSTLDSTYIVVGWGKPAVGNPQVQIVAAYDNTEITVTPSSATLAGGSVPALSAGVPYTFPTLLNDGDFLQLESSTDLNGTVITASQPVAVFSSNWCASIPFLGCCCDHVEEQLPGLSRWGTTYVASRLPVRSTGTPEASTWHIVAAQNDTRVSFLANAEVTGLPTSPQVLGAGVPLLFSVSGTMAVPGDFLIHADKPILVMQYLSGAFTTNVAQDLAGDPAMVLMPAPDQFLDSYLLAVPAMYALNFLVLVKAVGETVELDGTAVPETSFLAIDDGIVLPEWEVARIPVVAGAHRLTGSAPFGLIQSGWDAYDSYAHPAGMGMRVLNP